MKFRIAAAIMAFCINQSIDAQTITIGDRDCFGGAGGVGPGPCVAFPEPALGTSFRSAGEASATNGAQQTDFYSVLFDPLPESFALLFPTGNNVTSATFSYRSYGLMALVADPFSATVNGVARDLFNFTDGATAIAIHSIVLGPADLASINSLGGVTIGVSRGDSFDAAAFDYFELTYTTITNVSTVPEPTTSALMIAGLLALGAAARKRRHSA